MKKTRLNPGIGAMMPLGSAFAQHTQPLAFTGASDWIAGTTVGLSVNLTFGDDSQDGSVPAPALQNWVAF